MSAFLERLQGGPTLLLDGGFGSLLIARGLPAGAAPETWNLERPEEITAAHRAYVEAGSAAVHTNTFGGTPLRLARVGPAVRCARVNAEAVRLARQAQPAFVIGDVGPTGEYLPPVGSGDPASWRAAFTLQGRALAETGVDALHVETISDLREALIALEALRAVAPRLPVMVSMTFQRKKRGFFTVMGDPLVASLRALAGAGAAAVGANCTLASSDMRALAAEARPAVSIPLVIQPNAGQPDLSSGAARYAQAPEDFARDLAAIVDLGVEAVGGCCGTDPRFIACAAAQLAATAAR